MPDSDIVITGLGVVSPLGIGRETFWQSILDRKSGIRSLGDRDDDAATPDESERNDPFWLGAPILGFDARQYVRPRKALKVMCREIQTAFAASDLAIADAGLSDCVPADPDGPLPPSRIGAVFGSEMFYGPPIEMVAALRGCMRDDGTVDESRFGAAAMKGVMPLWMLKYLPNMPACQVGIAINAQGPNNSLVLGDVSGPAALIESVSCLRRGHADVMLGGASGTRINTTRLNYRLDYPIATASYPDDANSPPATGVIGGEGSVAMTLERADFSETRPVTAMARWLGHASRFHASGAMNSHSRSSDPARRDRGSSTAVANAIHAAMADARLEPSDVTFVVSHAMGDGSMDIAEDQAVRDMFGDVPILAPMKWIGHCGAASGLFGVATAVCVLQANTPSSIGLANIPWRNGNDSRAAKPQRAAVGVCLSHTSEGSATAIILGSAASGS